MPQWGVTEYKFYSKEKEVIQDFQKKLIEYTKNFGVPPNDADQYLGNILIKFKVETEESLKEKALNSWIKEIEKSILQKEGYYYFSLLTDDIWHPHPEFFKKILKEYYKEKIQMAYIMSDTDCGVFKKYDIENLFYENAEFALDYYIPNEADPKYWRLENLPLDLSLNQLKSFFEANSYEEVMQKINDWNEELQDYEDEGFIELHEIKNIAII